MDLEAKLVICPIRHLIITERHVSHSHIKEIILKIGLFKTADTHIGFRIKLLCDTPRDIIKLYTV